MAGAIAPSCLSRLTTSVRDAAAFVLDGSGGRAAPGLDDEVRALARLPAQTVVGDDERGARFHKLGQPLRRVFGDLDALQRVGRISIVPGGGDVGLVLVAPAAAVVRPF